MKQRNRKLRKQARMGRPAREDVPRRENGRIDYREIERQERDRPMATVIDARMRMWGLSEDQAKTPIAGTVFGRMYLQGEVTPEQWEAGAEFNRRRAAHLSAIAAPPPPRSGSDMGYMREPLGDGEVMERQATRVREDEENYADRCNRARRRFADIRRAALDADGLGVFAIEMVVVEDKRTEDEAVMGALRIALNAISRMLRIERKAS